LSIPDPDGDESDEFFFRQLHPELTRSSVDGHCVFFFRQNPENDFFDLLKIILFYPEKIIATT
jgi:hypothetical protein